MARDLMDTDVSTEAQDWTFDDIFQAAKAASQQESDGEDPYGPQPKRFMQTEQQKKRHARDLEIRRMAWTMRKMKKTHKAIHQRLKKQKQGPSAFEKLPSDLVLTVIQHTHWRNISKISNSSAINRKIFKANKEAILRGMEIEQFPEWKWLFGTSRHRSPAQAQHLKDAIISEDYSSSAGAYGWAYDEQLLEILQMIDENKFTGMRNVVFLQGMQDRLDMDHRAIESYTTRKIARRTAMCLKSFRFRRPEIVKEENREEDQSSVGYAGLPWEARCQLVKEQPASIQAEIRMILKIVVEKYCAMLEEVARRWIERNYDNQEMPREERKWMSKVMGGLVLEALMPEWRAETLRFSQSTWDLYVPDLLEDLARMLDEYDGGDVDVITSATEDGVRFGMSIGLELEGFLDGV